MASFRRRLALAACVALVVTCCFSTCMIGGRRGTFPPCGYADAAMRDEERPRVAGGAMLFDWMGGSCCDWA